MIAGRYLILGSKGQVGRLLVQRCLADGCETLGYDLPELNIANAAAVTQVVNDFCPTHILNAAAYNTVDRAEDEPDAAFCANSFGPAILALAARRLNAVLVHYSSDYVFDGETDQGFVETDAPNPISTYGQSKLLGDRAVAAIWERAYVLRTAWVFAPKGNNFVSRLLALADKGVSLRFTNDQWGTPTYADDLVNVTLQLIARQAPFGLYNAVGSEVCSPFEWARSALAIARPGVDIQPVPGITFPTRARRPRRSVLYNARLATLGLTMPGGLSRLNDYFAHQETR